MKSANQVFDLQFLFSVKRALKKMAARTHITKHYRERVQVMKARENKRLLKMAYVEGFKQTQALERIMTCKTEATFLSMHNFMLQFGFQALKYRAEINTEGDYRKKEQATRQIMKTCDRFLTLRQRHVHQRIKEWSVEKGFIQPKLKVCFKLHKQWRTRHALLHWVS